MSVIILIISLISLDRTFFWQVSYRVEYPQDYQNLSEEDHRDFKHTRYGNSYIFSWTSFSLLCQTVQLVESICEGSSVLVTS